jgi:hypothetical protein
VMEKPDTVEQEHARKQRRFNHNGLSGYWTLEEYGAEKEIVDNEKKNNLT